MGKIADALSRFISNHFELFVLILLVFGFLPIAVITNTGDDTEKTHRNLLIVQSSIALIAMVIALLGIFVAPKVSIEDQLGGRSINGFVNEKVELLRGGVFSRVLFGKKKKNVQNVNL